MAQRIQRGFTTKESANEYRDAQRSLKSVTKADTEESVDLQFTKDFPLPKQVRVVTWYVTVQFDPNVSDD